MRALRLRKIEPIEEAPLKLEDVQIPEPGEGQLLVRVLTSGICHTDLHIAEGDIHPPALPIIPGHQAVGKIEALGEKVQGWMVGDRVGVPWLYRACGHCSHCNRGEENLCAEAEFTGFHHDGAYSEYLLANANFTLSIPDQIGDELAAPLLCAGIIGYRSLHKADLQPGETLGLIGFGASAHLAIQVALHWKCQVFVFTRSESHRKLASELGAAWVGGAEDEPPVQLDRAVLFAPSGKLVPLMLGKLRPGGTLAINAIHLTPIPEMPYQLIYGERTLRSVANATHQDGVEFLKLAGEIPVRAVTQNYPLEEANRALKDLKNSHINGAGVLIP